MSPTSSSPTTSGDKIKRRRITTACSVCRNRRVKCDRTRPTCTQCKKGEKTCKYADEEVGKLEFVDETPASVTGSATSSTPLLPDTWGSVIESQVDLIKKANNSKNGVPVWAVAEAEEPSRAQALQIRQITPVTNIIPIEALGENFFTTLTLHLPPRETCLLCFDHFVLSIHPIISVCHIPTLRRQYDRFWDDLSPSYPVESLTLILAVLYTGAANSTVVDIQSTSALLRLYEKIFLVVDFGSYHVKNIAASIQLLQGYTIMNTFKASYLAPFSAYGFLPQVIRFAQSLRLHVDKKTGDPAELEVRRRIWWHLLFLDVESTIATGLPPIIHRSGYTTQLPSLLHDHENHAPTNVSPRLEDFSPMMIAMQGHYQWANRMQIWFETLPSQNEVSHFKTLINTLIDLLPDIKQTESEWARIYLRMQIDRAYCMLGLRFWQLSQYKGTGCHSEVVQTARSFLTHYLHLSTLAPSTHLFWFITGLIQPLHAIVILLMHLSTCINIAEEEHLSRNLIDQIMSLRVNRIMNGGMVPFNAFLCGNANPRYLIMVKLRKRVWKKIGWDSDGKGIDPLGGRVVLGEVDGSGEGFMPDVEQAVPVKMRSAAPEQVMEAWNGDWTAEGTTGLEELDSILAGDPMDMFQWDEWESLTSEFFAS